MCIVYSMLLLIFHEDIPIITTWCVHYISIVENYIPINSLTKIHSWLVVHDIPLNPIVFPWYSHYIQIKPELLCVKFQLFPVYGGFLKWWYLQIIYVVFELSTILIINHPFIGVPPFMETPICEVICGKVLHPASRSVPEDGRISQHMSWDDHHNNQHKSVNP